MPPESKQKACLKLIKDIIMQYTKSPRLLRLPEVTQITRLSRSSIYSYINAGIFPKSVSLGARSVAWVESEVLEWIDSRIQERDQIVAA